MTSVLYDELGPRGRVRVRIATVVVSLLLAGLVSALVRRFADSGQLDAEVWEHFTDVRVLRRLAEGLSMTVRAAVVAMVLAIALGALLAVGRLGTLRPVRWLSASYVEVFRALPLLLLIYFSARGLDQYGIHLSAFWILVVPLVAYNGAVLAEIFRAGILSLDRGQSEAAYAVGLTYPETMAYVLVPQAVRRMLPSLVSQLVTLLKDTSLGFVIPLLELTRWGQIIGEQFSLLPTYVVVAAIYVAVNFSLSRLARRLEVRQVRRYGAAPMAVGGVEDLAALSAVAIEIEGDNPPRKAPPPSYGE